MAKRLVIWGASGHARVLWEFLAGDHELVGLFDNDPNAVSPFPGVPIFHGRKGFTRWSESRGEGEFFGLVAIGGSRGRDRCEIHDWFVKHELTLCTAIHPSAYVAGDAIVGMGSHVLANATVCTSVRMGRQCIVNTASSVDHESILGDGVHLAPGVILTGRVNVGAHTLIGAGSTVLPDVRIGADATVGAGSLVTRDVPDGVVVWGSPARIRRHHG
ncbi:MAG: acetyltransferase [Acidobacteriota bacterium]